MEDNKEDFTNYSGETLEHSKDIFNAALLDSGTPGTNAPLMNSLRSFRIFGKGPAMMPLADDTIGLSFVTRPQLNLIDDVIARSERLKVLKDVSGNSIGAYIRGTLDERWAAANPCPALDNANPFIVALTTYLKTSNGFGDLSMQIQTTDPGMREQVYQRVASKLEENGLYSMNQTYFNPKPSVIPALFQYWMTYISEVTSGDRGCYPRAKYLFGNRIDYDTRIYHLIMNKDGEFLEQIFATVQSIPVTFPSGSQANIDNTQNSLRGEGQDDFSVQFSSTAMRFNEPGLIQAFNEHSYMYNPNIRPKTRDQYFRRLSADEYLEYGYSGAYPLLLPVRNDRRQDGAVGRDGIKLTWWVRK
ncbi:hypothetical protein PQC07_gp191 [Aeromonas phage D3]|uniref:Virion structural protein n=3 Tax=Ludhianavirus TaxID=3044751 RepID=A0A514TVN1_9CAUD|nr:putative structural protein [Aeromonas phage LAh10]YP_010668565.1 hypothetical protein PQC07_gp191 [Aeromonas phage D3]YP_010668831.1 hypothetical protein PQC08_gp192 [Aeromonas phage D6]QEP52388.1 hypothetical protein D9_0181 [Aeromonas phage D9]QDH47075.1 putative structural protein [Aeromonas phage LAh10]QDJ97082.1 hypothetical protein D3_0084 [Aeromonas phage D3]QDJ97243.1 hypothetical protein D6_0083 [Aeromonas phage D6]